MYCQATEKVCGFGFKFFLVVCLLACFEQGLTREFTLPLIYYRAQPDLKLRSFCLCHDECWITELPHPVILNSEPASETLLRHRFF